MSSLKGRDFLTINDFTKEELTLILETSRALKLEAKRGVFEPILKQKAIGLLFDQPSTRTRISFEVGIQQMGGIVLYLRPDEIHLGKKESLYDTAKVLERFLDAIVIRWNDQQMVDELAKHADIPVINAMTNVYHPLQALADFLTIHEKFGTFKGLKMTFFGPPSETVSRSAAIMSSKLGLHFCACCPKQYFLPQEYIDELNANNELSGGMFTQTDDINEATAGCHIVHTDVWWWYFSEEDEIKERKAASIPYQVTAEVLAKCDKNVIFQHCLPATRGFEVTDEVMDGPHSVVFDEAENRLHTEKAVLSLIL